jgi:transposase
MTDTPLPMFSVREVAEIIGIRAHSVTALIRTRELRATDISLRPGGRPTWRVSRDELESFLRRRTQSVAPPRRRKRVGKTVTQYF